MDEGAKSSDEGYGGALSKPQEAGINFSDLYGRASTRKGHNTVTMLFFPGPWGHYVFIYEKYLFKKTICKILICYLIITFNLFLTDKYRII